MEQEIFQEEIFKRLRGLQDTVTAIDVSIQGDEKRGVVGVRQHIQGINENFAAHQREDNVRFGKLEANTSKVSQQMSKAKYWVMGAGAIIGIIWAIAKVLIEIVK